MSRIPFDIPSWWKDAPAARTAAGIVFPPGSRNKLVRKVRAILIKGETMKAGKFSELTLHWDADKKEATAEKVARAADQDFTLANATGVEINAVYVSPSEADHWGKDILGKDTLPDGEEADIEFSPEEESALWDLKIEDKEGNAIIWTKLNLTEISTLTLHWDADTKKATAEAE